MFINKTTYTKKIFRESIFLVLKLKGALLIRTFAFMLIIIFAVTLGIYEAYKRYIGNFSWFLTGVFLFWITIIGFAFFFAFRGIRQRIQVIYHGNEMVMVCEISDQIVTQNLLTKGRVEYKYSQIVKIIESKNLIMLVIKGNLAVMLQKDGFIQGSWKECKDFILQKCRECK